MNKTWESTDLQTWDRHNLNLLKSLTTLCCNLYGLCTLRNCMNHYLLSAIVDHLSSLIHLQNLKDKVWGKYSVSQRKRWQDLHTNNANRNTDRVIVSSSDKVEWCSMINQCCTSYSYTLLQCSIQCKEIGITAVTISETAVDHYMLLECTECGWGTDALEKWTSNTTTNRVISAHTYWKKKVFSWFHCFVWFSHSWT